MGVAGYFDDVVEVREDVDPDDVEEFDFDPPEIPVATGRGASDEMERYFAMLESRMRQEYELARRCREKGLDPETRVEIPPAIDLAARVEELVGPKGVAVRIRELSKEKNREELSLIVAKEVAAGKFNLAPDGTPLGAAGFESKEKALDQAVRTGLAILTEGILVAPLEGIAGVRLHQNDNGTDCCGLLFAGPIRAAGGTGQALSVLIADVVRRELGIGKYIPTEREISRMKEEIPAYKAAANLQYTPSNDEIELIMRNCPVMIDGEGTEKDEIGGNRDLPRIETNQIRGGACLVLAEGMTQKAPKIQKNVKALGLDGWEFIDQIIELVKKKGASGKGDAEGGKKFTDPWAKESELVIPPGEASKYPGGRPPIEPNPKYMADLIAGRPVFAHPSRKGGWRLRYGRSRTGGLATTSIHPAAMALVDDFLAPGTQMKIERPGKATACTPCDTIEPPMVLLANGSFIEVPSYKIGRQVRPLIRQVVDLGEMLVPYGEFAENNKQLPQSPWCEEWWRFTVAAALGVPAIANVAPIPAGEAGAPASATSVPEPESSAAAFELAERTKTPLHPRWNLFWHDITLDDIKSLSEFVEAHGQWIPVPPRAADPNAPDAAHLVPQPEAFTLELPRAALDAPLDAAAAQRAPSDVKATRTMKDMLVELGALHEATKERVRLGRHAYALLRGLGLDVDNDKIVRRHALDAPDTMGVEGSCAYVSVLAGVKLRPRAMFRIGTRMGRPEKAAERKMNPPVHLLFPIGIAGGPQRLMADAVKANKFEIEIGDRACPQCKKHTVLYACPDCAAHTESVPPKTGNRLEPRLIEVAPLWNAALERLRMDAPPQVKAVQGLISRAKAPEPMEKGILRAKHGLFTFKDATVRFDMININCTHFKPREAHVSVEKLRELGYERDVRGDPLTRDDQVLELRVQDVIVSTGCMDYMLRTSQYIDDLLVRFYGFKPFYNCKSREDLYGHLFVALAPHTSGGVLCRIIGHTRAQGHYGHPYFHAAKRRNCIAPDSDVYVLRDQGVERVPIASLWDAAAPSAVEDDIGTLAQRLPESVRVLAVDRATGKVTPRAVTQIYRRTAPPTLLRIQTASGRTLTCSPDHRMEVVIDGKLQKRPAKHLIDGDILCYPRAVPFRATDAEPIDLLVELLPGNEERLVVRGLRAKLDTWIAEAGGLKAAAAASGVGMKALDNYRRRDSIPAATLKRLLESRGERLVDAVPHDARLAIARDTVEIPRFLPMSPALMRLVGYYLAEGHARGKAGHWFQVSFAATEQEIVADIVECTRAVFGLLPTPSDVSVTISSRLVHELFTRVLALGASSHQKRIPARIANLPHTLTRELLAAYFAGDGSVEEGRLHVACHSVNRGLLRDVGLQLASRGISYRLSTSTRPAGGAVAEFLTRKNRPLREFTSHRLSIRSEHAVSFAQEIGFTLSRKQKALEAAQVKVRATRMRQALGDLVEDEIVAIDHLENSHEHIYDLEVEEDHNFLVNDLMLTSNCDGDEDCVMLLLDGLLNFSRAYLPSNRGGLMDAPLTLTMRLDPSEVDKEAHNVDTMFAYPLEFYEATMKHPGPKDVEKLIEMVGKRLGTPAQYEGFGFTHDTADIAEGPELSAYKTIGSMMDKMTAQLELAARLRGVDAPDVAARVIGSHFLPDMMGNLKAFSKQSMRCTKCNTKYRRIPLMGKCRKCGNANLTMTVHEGSVKKYLEVSKEVCVRFEVSNYVQQRIEHISDSIDSVFSNDRVRKAKLSDFF